MNKKSKHLDINRSENFNGLGLGINFDDYGILLYFAFTISNEKAKRLYEATLSEYYFRLENEIPLEGLSEIDFQSHASSSSLLQVVEFIKDDILPNLEGLSPTLDFTNTWEVGGSLDRFLISQGSFFLNFHVDDVDIDGFNPPYLIELFNRLLSIFEESIINDSYYFVRVSS